MTVDSHLRFSTLDRTFDRSSFSCGVESLDDFIAKHAYRQQTQNVGTTWVCHENLSAAILGFYTIAATSIVPADLPIDHSRGLPPYPSFPAAIIGRLAVDTKMQGSGIGEILLRDALERIAGMAAGMGINVIVVDAIDERAEAFYRRFGFYDFPERLGSLFLPVSTVKAAMTVEK